MPQGLTFNPVSADSGRGSQLCPDAGARPGLQALGLRVLCALRVSALQKIGEHLTFALYADLSTTLEVIMTIE